MTEYGYLSQNSRVQPPTLEFKQHKNIRFELQQVTDHSFMCQDVSKVSLKMDSGQGVDVAKKSLAKSSKKQNLKAHLKSLKQIGKKMRENGPKKQKNVELDEMQFKNNIQNYRISNLIKQFVEKLSRTSVSRSPVEYNPFQYLFNEKNDRDGVEMTDFMLTLFFGVSALLTLGNCLLASFLLIFQPTQQLHFAIFPFSIVNILWTIFETGFGFVRVNESGKKKLYKIKQISKFYIRKQLIINIIYLCSTILSTMFIIPFHQIPNLLTLIKIPDALQKLKTIQCHLIHYFYEEQYWNLFKMFIANFIFAHIVAIILFLMADSADQDNWMKAKNIANVSQIDQYCWAYYWATTIILSVGFGDIVAVNPKQALILVVVQIVGCMALAYNINRIGTMLQSIQDKQSQKQKKIKLIQQMCNRNELQNNIEFKLTNHIKEEYKINQKYNFDQSIKLVSTLPKALQQEYKRCSNKKILQKISFMRNFTNKTVLRIAEKLEQKMLHPWELVFNPVVEAKDILILQQGSIGLCANFGINKFNQIAIDEITVNGRHSSVLVSLDFVRPYQLHKNYQQKATSYSIIGCIGYSEFLEILKLKTVDAQFFFSLRDKQRNNPEDLELIQCNQCKRKHSKFTCPRLHFSPIRQVVIHKNLTIEKNSRVSRQFTQRVKQSMNALKLHSIFYLQLASGDCSQDSSKVNIRSIILKSRKVASFSCHKIQDPFLTTISIREQRKQRISVEGKTEQCLQNNTLTQNRMDMLKSTGGFKGQLLAYILDVWMVQTDRLSDFKFYFPECNPKQLSNMHQKQKRQNKRFQKQLKSKLMLKKAA